MFKHSVESGQYFVEFVIFNFFTILYQQEVLKFQLHINLQLDALDFPDIPL